MTSYLATACPKCSKWIPLRECEPEEPTFDPSLLLQVSCANCGESFKVTAATLEVVPKSKVLAS